jgi:hypothetical protein
MRMDRWSADDPASVVDVVPRLQHMGGRGMAQAGAGGGLGDTRRPDRGAEGALYNGPRPTKPTSLVDDVVTLRMAVWPMACV